MRKSWMHSGNGSADENSFSSGESKESDECIGRERDHKGSAQPESVGNAADRHRQQRSTEDSEAEQARGRALRHARPFQRDRENRRKHDRVEEPDRQRSIARDWTAGQQNRETKECRHGPTANQQAAGWNPRQKSSSRQPAGKRPTPIEIGEVRATL